jgi:hypothetical protein
MSTTKALTGPLLKSGSKTSIRSCDYITRKIDIYHVKKYAIYVDHTTKYSDISYLIGDCFVGFYTFDVNLVGNKYNNNKVIFLSEENITGENIDGWLIASTNRASAFSLSIFLKNIDLEYQIIVRLYGGQTSEIDAYMDFFAGPTRSLNYINHYFNRKYRVVFPIDVRYQIRDCKGNTIYSGQRIIKPSGITVIDSNDFEFNGSFKGYLYIELEVENLQVRVQPFIHFWADYISDSGMCRNHQSGWSQHPAGSVFNRGIMPVSSSIQAIGSFYNENSFPITPDVLLHYNKNGHELKIERKIKEVRTGCISYVNYSKLFNDVDFTGVDAAYILTRCDHPMHRPNHYIKIKNCEEFIDTYHQTRGGAMHWAPPSMKYSKKEIELFDEYGVYPWLISIPILPLHSLIESYIGLLSEVVAMGDNYHVGFYNHESKLVFTDSKEFTTKDKHFFNINEYLNSVGVDCTEGGLFIVTAKNNEDSHRGGHPLFFGLKHKKFNYISTSFREGQKEAQLSLYMGASMPNVREYRYSFSQISDLFSPQMISSKFDSLNIIVNQSLDKGVTKEIEYKLEVIDEDGHSLVIYKKIKPMSYDTFWLSDIVDTKEDTDREKYYTIWITSGDAYLKSFHGLYRKSDHALSFDDGSEGTLQVDPQIEGIDPNSFINNLAKTVKSKGFDKYISGDIKVALKKRITR